MCTIWCGLLAVAVIGGIGLAIILPIWAKSLSNIGIFVILLSVMTGALAFFLLFCLLIAFAAFMANVI